MLRIVVPALLGLVLMVGCGDSSPKQTLLEARRGFETKLTSKRSSKAPVPQPPADLFQIVHYDSPIGKMAAYLSQTPRDGRKHPAIIWILGGFSNGIGATAWREGPPDNDQSAGAFRKAGIVMMYPSLRGGSSNPGVQEGFFGEVDDVLAAADFLTKQDFVDPARIYLGGHSTGGTLALLVAAYSDRFRAVFSFGPVEDVIRYGPDKLPFDLANSREPELRAPIRWLHAIKNPVFVIEGTQGNIGSLEALSGASTNSQIHFHPVKGAGHFDLLAPITRLAANKIVNDTGPSCNIAFSENQLTAAMRK